MNNLAVPMEKDLKTPPPPPKTPPPPQSDLSQTPPQNNHSDQKSPYSAIYSGGCITGSTPDRLKVPKSFKYPERYTSPTDLMMSPISKGLLARNKKPTMLLPPTIQQTKIHELKSGGGSFSKLKDVSCS